jgi:hypothetical protein
MTKSLGQVAYEALERHFGIKPDWDGRHDSERSAWQAAAEAVAVKVLREQPNVIVADHELHPDAKQAIMETTRKRSAVIEAAEGARQEIQDVICDADARGRRRLPKLQALPEATDALKPSSEEE